MPNKVKVTKAQWIETAKDALIEEGLGGVKVDRLAKTLGVTRGGFYHHFKSHQDLLEHLIKHWANSNDFLPPNAQAETSVEALNVMNGMISHLIAEKAFSPAFEMAVREWARIDGNVRKAVDKIDKSRVDRITHLFKALGYEQDEAVIRARVLYFHQMGFYNLGHHKRQSKSERLKNAPTYMRILCGQQFLEIAESAKVAATEA